MPHMTIEYSATLDGRTDMQALCADLARCLREFRADGLPVYPVGGVRVRALACEAFSIADGSPGTDFVHGSIRMGAGRSEPVRKATGDAAFEVMKRHFADLFERQGLALSLEVSEFSEAGTWKHNNLHKRLQAST